jgi:hypothetical protein
MIHETKETIERLLDYAHFLVYEWGWKRGSDSSQLHLDEYLELVSTINMAQRLLIRMETVDHLKEK